MSLAINKLEEIKIELNAIHKTLKACEYTGNKQLAEYGIDDLADCIGQLESAIDYFKAFNRGVAE